MTTPDVDGSPDAFAALAQCIKELAGAITKLDRRLVAAERRGDEIHGQMDGLIIQATQERSALAHRMDKAEVRIAALFERMGDGAS